MKKYSRNLQRGAVNILLVGLAGVGVMALTASNLNAIRTAQDQQFSLHTNTQATANAWDGVELFRLYLKGLSSTDLAALAPGASVAQPVTVDITGVSSFTAAVVGHTLNGSVHRITANITGKGAGSSATVQVVYGVSPQTTASNGQQCGLQPLAATVFKGDLSIKGGTTTVTSPTGNAKVAIEGNLTISNSSSPTISGCAKGDITMSGGGIDQNATLYSGGKISITNMSPPVNATLWAKTIDIGNSGSGSYAALNAGAYSASVQSAGAAIGATQVGGKLIATTAGKTTPWTTGTVVPVSAGYIVITLTDGTTFLLDMSKVTIAPATGIVTTTASAYARLGGRANFPTTPLTFVAQSIYGGDIELYTLTVSNMWGHALTVKGSSGTYGSVSANGNFLMGTGSIASLTGGSYLKATSGGCSSSKNCWNFPTLTAGKIADRFYYGSGTPPTNVQNASLPNLQLNQTNTSPGLPGVPFCDTRVSPVDANAYKSQANYVFEMVGTTPRLTIKNISDSAGNLKDGVYDLNNADTRAFKVGGNNRPFMTCNYQAAGNSNAYCMRKAKSWSMKGITNFPPGIAWFDGPVTIDGTDVNLNNTLMAKGLITLTSAGHKDLIAPNFSTPAIVCDGAFYPTNLCQKTPAPSTFKPWTDGIRTYSGLPIANMAILTEGGLAASGWTIKGNVMLGGGLNTDGAATNITGSLGVGVNGFSATDITAGGLNVVTTTLSASQAFLPNGNTCTSTNGTGTGGEANIFWTRYL